MKDKTRIAMLCLAGLLALALAGCSDGTGLDDEGNIGSEDGVVGADSGESRLEEDGSDGSEEVTVGGFSVQGPEGEEISVPEAEADPGDVAGYTESVRSIIDDTTRDFSSFVDP